MLQTPSLQLTSRASRFGFSVQFPQCRSRCGSRSIFARHVGAQGPFLQPNTPCSCRRRSARTADLCHGFGLRSRFATWPSDWNKHSSGEGHVSHKLGSLRNPCRGSLYPLLQDVAPSLTDDGTNLPVTSSMRKE